MTWAQQYSLGLYLPLPAAAAEDYSDPGVANVREATEYLYAGDTLTGTLVAAADPPTYPSLVEATSFLSLPKHLLREMIARSATWRTLVGAVGSEEAKLATARARVHLVAMHEFEEISAPRPFWLIVGPIPSEIRYDNGYTGNDSGTVRTYFEMDVPADYQGDDEQDVTDAETHFLNTYGAIVSEVMALCGTDYDAARTYPIFQTSPLETAPMRSDKRQGEADDYWQQLQDWNYGNE